MIELIKVFLVISFAFYFACTVCMKIHEKYLYERPLISIIVNFLIGSALIAIILFFADYIGFIDMDGWNNCDREVVLC